ncbi:hypothetical protein E3N88_00351 [Mikania micrantha]|uniref:Uncharacterized protein n=1 Tax=Mikania micrantha TaxID=192012 RepID=A0A5N6PXS6_9ASTR|nr:hypothetical protein E3N88_00351 [Mikania micrantha]
MIKRSLATIQCINQDIESMLFDDGGPTAYKARLMEVRTKDHLVEEKIHQQINGNMMNDDEEEEEEVCVICQGDFQTGEVCGALE